MTAKKISEFVPKHEAGMYGAGMPPVWVAKMLVFCEDKTEGPDQGIPRAKVSYGEMEVHGRTWQEARARAKRVFKDLYAENVYHVQFLNTHRAEAPELLSRRQNYATRQYFPGLEMKFQ